MTNLAKLGVAALLALAVPVSTAVAQTNQNPPPKSAPSRDAGDQFKSATEDLGKGFEHLGEGIKQGAIQTWDAVKSGAETAGDKLSGKPSNPPKSPPSPTAPSH